MIDGYTSALKVKLRAVAIKWKFSELPFDRIIIELYIMIRLLNTPSSWDAELDLNRSSLSIEAMGR